MRLAMQQTTQTPQLGGIPTHRVGHRIVPQPANLTLPIAELRNAHVPRPLPAGGEGLQDTFVLDVGDADVGYSGRGVNGKVQLLASVPHDLKTPWG